MSEPVAAIGRDAAFASAWNAVAIGRGAQAHGNSAFALGRGAIAREDYEVVITEPPWAGPIHPDAIDAFKVGLMRNLRILEERTGVPHPDVREWIGRFIDMMVPDEGIYFAFGTGGASASAWPCELAMMARE